LHDARRSDDLSPGPNRGGAIVEGALEGVKGEIAGAERKVRAQGHRRIRRACELVADAVVGAGVEVARGARGATVAAHLHIPEQRFAKGDERTLVGNVSVEPGRLRHRDAAQRRDGAAGALRGQGSRYHDAGAQQ